MKKILFILSICLFLSVGNLFAQSIQEIVKNPITKEYFLKPLKQEIKQEHPYIGPEFTEQNIQDASRRAYKDCKECFEVKTFGYYSEFGYRSEVFEDEIKQQKSLAANNFFNIDFKEFISEGNFILQSYPSDFIGTYGDEPRMKDFKTFKSYHSSKLKEAQVKNKADQEVLYNKLLKKREELGKKLVQFYSEYDYKILLLKAFGERYSELYNTSYASYPSDEMKTLVVEKISPNFNLIDNILIYPEFTSKKNTDAENEELKKMLLDSGFVEITEWQKPSSDGYTFIFPKINDDLKKRAETLIKYFDLGNTDKAKWHLTRHRILELWYGNLTNAFTLNNFLTVCGSNVPSREDFIIDYEPLEDIVEEYLDVLNGRVGGNFKYDKEIKKYPKYILFKNILNNHYGIQNDEFEKIKKEQSANEEKELAAKGGIVRGRRYFKVNNQGKFDELWFYSSSLDLERTINQSKYYGTFKKESVNVFKITLTDKKTGIKLPEFEGRVSSDGKKLYLGEDKVPYKYEDPYEVNCLREKSGTWYSIDNKESFSTIGSTTWESSITGGISANGSLYKISANKYAFVIYETSWGGKLDNDLVIISTDSNCNTIYYGKGKKKMVYVK